MGYTGAGTGIAAGGGIPLVAGAPIGHVILAAALTAAAFAVYRFIPKRATR